MSTRGKRSSRGSSSTTCGALVDAEVTEEAFVAGFADEEPLNNFCALSSVGTGFDATFSNSASMMERRAGFNS